MDLKMSMPYYVGLTFLGILALRLFFRLIRGIRGHFFRSTVHFKDLGAWAIVTGSTDGIGKAYAEELAKHGLHIFLLSRSAEKLKETAAEIQSAYHVQTKWFAVDFTASDVYSKIAAELTDLDIGILVNNVGMSLEHPEFFQNLPLDVIEKIINVNALSVSMMSRIVLPSMIQKKKGLVINVSSASSMLPPALLSIYAASKAFVNTLSEALAIECRRDGVIVQNVAPFFVATKLSRLRAAFLVPTPTHFVKQSLKTVGHFDSTHGAVLHDLEGFILSLLPEVIVRRLVMSNLITTRTRALKKKAAAAKTD